MEPMDLSFIGDEVFTGLLSQFCFNLSRGVTGSLLVGGAPLQSVDVALLYCDCD